MKNLEFNKNNGPKPDSTIAALPDWARACGAGKHLQLPSELNGTLFRLRKASWLCSPDLSLRWNVILTNRQTSVCPDLWEDHWSTFRVPPGFLVVIGNQLGSRVEEELLREAERRAIAEQKAEFIRQRTQFHLDAKRNSWLSKHKLSDDELDHRRWRFKESTIAEVSGVRAQRARIEAIVRATKTDGRCMEVLSAWENPELRIEVDRAMQVFGVKRIDGLLSRAKGWPQDLLDHVKRLNLLPDPKPGPGMESFFDSGTEPHRE